MKRAALYIRVSTEEQARHGLSMGEQRQDLSEYAQKHNYIIVDLYVDGGCSARKALSRRHELQRLLNDVRAGRIDIIIFKCLDRWFRNIKDFYKVQEILDEHKVQWECTQEDYNTTTTNGRLMLNLKLSIAQNESDSTADRIRYINQGRARRGETLNNKCPYGYQLINKHYVPVPEQAVVVKFIFNHVLAGNSARSAVPIIRQNFDVDFPRNQMSRIIKNSIYYGSRYGNDKYCEPIISKEIFDRANEQLLTRKRWSASGRIYLFSGKVICPGCGGIMSAHYHRIGKKIENPNYVIHYECGRHKMGKSTACDYGGAVTESAIENYLLKNIMPLLQNYIATIKAKKADVDKTRKEIRKIEDKLARTKELYIDGIITREEFNNRHEAGMKEINKLQSDLTVTPIVPPAASKIIGAAEFQKIYSELPREKKKALWQELIKEIRMTRGLLRQRSSRQFLLTFINPLMQH